MSKLRLLACLMAAFLTGTAPLCAEEKISVDEAWKLYVLQTTVLPEPSSFEIEKLRKFFERITERLETIGDSDQNRFAEAMNTDRELQKMLTTPDWLHGLDVVRTGGAHVEPPGPASRITAAEDGGALLWIAGWNGLILRSDTHGGDWIRQTTGVSDHLEAIDFVDETTGFAVGHNGTVLRTRDGGASWHKLSGTGSVLHRDIDCLDPRHCWLTGEYPYVYRTSDGGETWKSSEVLPREKLGAILMLDKDRGVAAGRAIWRSDDGGETWARIRKLDQALSPTYGEGNRITALDTADGLSIWAVGRLGSGIGILASTDGGRNWMDQSGSVYPKGYLDVAQLRVPETHRANGVFALSESVAYLVATNGVILITVDGGAHWFVQEAQGESNFSFYDIVMRDGRVGWVVGNLGLIAGTNDAGRTWVPLGGAFHRFTMIAGKLVGIDPDRPSGYEVEQLLDNDKLDEALDLAIRVIGDAPGDAALIMDMLQPLYVHARSLYGTDQFAASADLFGALRDIAEPALGTTPESPEAGLFAARLSYHHGRSLRRIDAPLRALPALDEALRRAMALIEAQPGSQAIADLLGNIHHNRGRVFELLDRPEDAIASYVETVKYDPDDDIAFKRRGFLAFDIGDYAQSIDTLETAIALDPDNAGAINGLAWTYVAAGLPEFHQPERALELVRQALTLRQSAAYYDTLGAALLRTGDETRALEAYKTALAMDADYTADLVEDLGRLGCLADSGVAPLVSQIEAAVARCIQSGMPMFFLTLSLARVERIKASDPENARRHIEALERMAPNNPDVLRLQSEAAGWPEH